MSKIYKTTIVESLPVTGERDILYLVYDTDIDAFLGYVWDETTTQFLRHGAQYELATGSNDGLMSASDKTKLDGMDAAKLDGIGEILTGSETTTSVGNAATKVNDIRLTRGKWLIISMVRFSYNNAGGWRYSFISQSQISPSAMSTLFEDNGANVGGTTYNSRITGIINNTSDVLALYLFAQQNSGTNLNCKAQWQAIRIG